MITDHSYIFQIVELAINYVEFLSITPPPFQNQPDWAPQEVISHILSYTDEETLLGASMVCKSWEAAAATVDSFWRKKFYIQFVFFGETEWKKHFGDVVSPPSDVNYKDIYTRVSEFTRKWPKQWDKKMVWLQPEIETVAPKLRMFWVDRVGSFHKQVLTDIVKFNDASKKSCFVCMTPDIVPGTCNQKYLVQKRLVHAFGGSIPTIDCAVIGIWLKSLEGKHIFTKRVEKYLTRSGMGMYTDYEKYSLRVHSRCQEFLYDSGDLIVSYGGDQVVHCQDLADGDRNDRVVSVIETHCSYDVDIGAAAMLKL
jgi:hypothetical protein